MHKPVQDMQTTDSVDHDEPQLEELDRAECLRLLGTQSVGRVAVSQRGLAPHVVPVNYTVFEETIVFRSDDGTKFRLLLTEPVSFEADFVDDFHRGGWSVLVQGLAYEESEWEVALDETDVKPFAPGQKSHWARLVPHSITGRRIALPLASPFDPRGYR